ncbi:hypothetical protein Moror_15325 [Moniliophthora roreri MCA 2997]|uniref:Uncharacterized protein n=1 Tax=Moniliophthora roreri (strain MCA 2997) TaxID=1381753 RepID=V2X1Y1_MONRO|nr:hypothetical protein Moror_15325 [Moniliophthora roreri MCA 2997]
MRRRSSYVEDMAHTRKPCGTAISSGDDIVFGHSSLLVCYLLACPRQPTDRPPVPEPRAAAPLCISLTHSITRTSQGYSCQP